MLLRVRQYSKGTFHVGNIGIPLVHFTIIHPCHRTGMDHGFRLVVSKDIMNAIRISEIHYHVMKGSMIPEWQTALSPACGNYIMPVLQKALSEVIPEETIGAGKENPHREEIGLKGSCPGPAGAAAKIFFAGTLNMIPIGFRKLSSVEFF